MPRISYGPVLQTRVLRILECILRFANDELEVTQNAKIQYGWQEEGFQDHKLVVKTTINSLKYLYDHYDSCNPLEKTDIRDALHCLKDFVGILEDNRVNKQGSQDWHFTLQLRSKNVDENLKIVNNIWIERKNTKNKKNNSSMDESTKLLVGFNNIDELNSEELDVQVDLDLSRQSNGFPLPFNTESNRKWLEYIYIEEIRQMLGMTNIFSRSSYRKEIHKAENDPSFLSINKSNKSLVCESERNLKRSTRLGWNINQAIKIINKNPIHLAISPAHAGSLAILTYLKERGININFDFHHPHSVDILENALQDNFPNQVDGFTLTLATAGALLRERAGKYSSSFMMPSMTHGIISSELGLEQSSMNGEYLVMKDLPSTEFFIYEDLVKLDILSKSRVTEMEPDEVTHALSYADNSIKSIIGFPHYNFNVKFNSCVLLNQPISHIKPVFLFLRNSVMIQPDVMQALSVLIRDAWLSILENPNVLRKIVDRLIRHDKYIETLSRITGISRIIHRIEPNFMKDVLKQELFIDRNLEQDINIRRTDVNSILKLRHTVLRNGYPIDEVIFIEDEAKTTRHYGVFDSQDKNICCVSLIESFWNSESAWQLRAMATSSEWRNRGIGRKLINYMISDLKQDIQLKYIWCNCRVQASGFYKKMGWREASHQFINGNAGLSIKMVKEFADQCHENNENLQTII
ncbi:GNAT family N-acetyltransferase [Acaryochloris marina NIES-2412]|uniref:GNAT family N-acetyltransferase n=1 Tax=Acaryochloris marina TaxID=155978 RepID=UPI004058C099